MGEFYLISENKTKGKLVFLCSLLYLASRTVTAGSNESISDLNQSYENFRKEMLF